MDEFEDLLCFIDKRLQAPEENVMAKELLDSMKFIPVLKRHWKKLQQNMYPVLQQVALDIPSRLEGAAAVPGEELSVLTNKEAEPSLTLPDMVLIDDFDNILACMGSLSEFDQDQVDVYLGLRNDAAVHETQTNHGEQAPVVALGPDKTTNSTPKDPKRFSAWGDSSHQHNSKQDRASLSFAPKDEK